MAAVTSHSDKAAELLEKLSLDSQTKTAAIREPSKKGMPGDDGSVLYHQGYGYLPYGTYPFPNSNAHSLGHDGQLYSAHNYQYPGPFYQPPTSASMPYFPDQTIPSQGSIPSSVRDKVPLSVGTAAVNSNRNNVGRPFKPSNRNSSSHSNISHKSGVLPTGFPSSGYIDPRYGYDGFQSSVPWFDANMFSNGPSRYGTSATFSSPLDSRTAQPTFSSGQSSGFMNLMYPNNRMYGQYGNRAGPGFGSYGSNSWTNGRDWVVVDNKYKPRGPGYGNENVDGLSELNKGPRAKGFRNQKEFGPVTQTDGGQNLLMELAQVPEKEQYNKEDFPEDYSDAKFFVIKSFSEDDVHKAIKYSIWSSTPNGNKKLDAAYKQVKENNCPVFLLFSVNGSGQFVGLAEMVGPVDFDRSVQYWQQDKWIGCFPLKWHIIKDVPNSSLRHITLENNENKPVTNSRDTQEVFFEKGIQILKIIKGHEGKTSILDDFGFYAARERIIQEQKAKQNIQKQVSDGKAGDDMTNHKDTSASIGKDSLRELSGVINGEVKLPEENGLDGAMK